MAQSVVEMLAAVTAVHDVHECARGGSGEIGYGAAPDAYAAVYASRRGITVALDPEDARTLVDAFGFPCVATNPTTHYVRVSQERLADGVTAARVQQTVDLAFRRSWKGPRWQRESSASSRTTLAATCPVHGYELPVSGWCLGCDDQAPTL